MKVYTFSFKPCPRLIHQALRIPTTRLLSSKWKSGRFFFWEIWSDQKKKKSNDTDSKVSSSKWPNGLATVKFMTIRHSAFHRHTDFSQYFGVPVLHTSGNWGLPDTCGNPPKWKRERGLKKKELVWLSGLSAGLQTERSTGACLGCKAGPQWGRARGNHTLMFLSGSFSLPSRFSK